MNFHNKTPGDTLAVLQARQLALEKQLKEDAKVVATRVVASFAEKKDWPQEDLDEVLGALGLTQTK